MMIWHYLTTVRIQYMILVSAISLRWGYLGTMVILLVEYTFLLETFFFLWLVNAQTKRIQHCLTTVRTRYISAISLHWGYLGMAVIRLVEYACFLGIYCWIVLSLVSQRTD